MEVVFVSVVVGHVDVFVLIEAVGREEVVRLITRERDPLGNENKGTSVVDNECDKKKDDKPFSDGEVDEPVQQVPKYIFCLPIGVELNEPQGEKAEKYQDPEGIQSSDKVISGQIVRGEEWSDKEEK